MSSTIKRGDFVTYRAGSANIEALVERAHRDGSVTVEARFVLDEDGKARPGFLGYRYRMAVEDVRPSHQEAA